MSLRPMAVIVPSRGRPDKMTEFIHNWWTNSGNATDLYVVVDSDDPKLADYQKVFEDQPAAVALVVQTVPGSMVAALNLTAVSLARVYSALIFMGDDHRPRTVCWDQAVQEALEVMGTGIVTGPDGLRQDQLPTWCGMTSDIVNTLGYMAPPALQHMFVDNAWQALGEALDRFGYLPEVLVEHLHPVAGKAPLDEGYLRVNDPGVYARDEAHYIRWVTHELADAVARIRAGMPAEVER